MCNNLACCYGFTEPAFNFQTDNFRKGGKGNDPVLISIQDTSGTSHAACVSLPSGQSAQCRMFIWTNTLPNCDCALKNAILVHELTHTISNRLTGGGTATCLQTTEAGSAGKAWPNAMAFFTEQTNTTIVPFTYSAYVSNNAAGIRSVRYSTGKSIDPYTYATVGTQNEVHAIGETWATVMMELYSVLVGQYGFAANYFDSTSAASNIKFLHLFMDTFSLQPCNPTFLTARNAIIQADVNRFGGTNKCLLWMVCDVVHDCRWNT